MLLRAEKHGHIDCSKIPNYNDKDIPDGYTETAEFFVDNSGFGAEGEAALTIDQFKKENNSRAILRPDSKRTVSSFYHGVHKGMITAQDKIKIEYGVDHDYNTAALLISTDGDVSSTGYYTHVEAYFNASTTMTAYLKAGGTRVKSVPDLLCCESYGDLTDEQLLAIGRIIRKNDYSKIIVSINGRWSEHNSFDRLTMRNFKQAIGELQ